MTVDSNRLIVLVSPGYLQGTPKARACFSTRLAVMEG
jgi:hypothetical protein